MKVLQILRAIKIFIYDFIRESAGSLVISIDKFFKPMLRNSIMIDQNRHLHDYFQKGRFQKLGDLLKCRVVARIKGKGDPSNLLRLPRFELLSICKYLKKRDIYNLLRTNSQLYQINDDSRFWNQLYHTRFKRTGFKIEQINWRSVFLDKSS